MRVLLIALLAAISYAQTDVEDMNVDLEISLLEKELEKIAIDGANSVSRKLLQTSRRRSSTSRRRSTATTRAPASGSRTTTRPRSGSSVMAFPTSYYSTPSMDYGLNTCRLRGSSSGYSQNSCSNGQYTSSRYGSSSCSGSSTSTRTTSNLNSCSNRRDFYGDDLYTTIDCNNGRSTQRLCGSSNKQNCRNSNATSTGCTMHMCGELCCIDNYDEAFVHSYLSENTFKGSCNCGNETYISQREADLNDGNRDPMPDTVDFFTCTDYNQWVVENMPNSCATLSSILIAATLAWKMM